MKIEDRLSRKTKRLVQNLTKSRQGIRICSIEPQYGDLTTIMSIMSMHPRGHHTISILRTTYIVTIRLHY